MGVTNTYKATKGCAVRVYCVFIPPYFWCLSLSTHEPLVTTSIFELGPDFDLHTPVNFGIRMIMVVTLLLQLNLSTGRNISTWQGAQKIALVEAPASQTREVKMMPALPSRLLTKTVMCQV